jgi:PAS domain S-box-containing protein
MNTPPNPQSPDVGALLARLAEAEETLRAIYAGEVDALVVRGPEGEQVFTLKGAETPYRLLLEAMNEGALTLTRDETILYCNSRFAQMAQRPLEQIISSSWQQYFPAAEHAAFTKLLERAQSKGAKGEFTLRTGSASGVPVEISVRSFTLDEMQGFSVLVTDISQFKRSEQALREVNEQLEERTAKLQEMVGELEHFSYTITHDMRAPLRAMQGFGRTLQEGCADCSHGERLDFIRRIVESAGRMDRLITDSLSYSKIVREEMELTPVDASAMLRGMIESYPQFQLPSAELQIEEPLPPVLANEAGLMQCFSNLLGNAVKFVRPGQLPQVRIRAEIRDEWVRFWFEDNGIGIAPEYHEQIFLLFQRLNKSYEGTGVGLALVRKAMERMKGKVGVESALGKGSRFWIELKHGG